MSIVPGSPASARRPLGRRAFTLVVCVGLSALAWGGVAREATKDVMPDSLLPWVLVQGGPERSGSKAAHHPQAPAQRPGTPTATR